MSAAVPIRTMPVSFVVSAAAAGVLGPRLGNERFLSSDATGFRRFLGLFPRSVSEPLLPSPLPERVLASAAIAYLRLLFQRGEEVLCYRLHLGIGHGSVGLRDRHR